MSGFSSKAVFLSYAHEDADAVRRIAEELRAAGIEVWFDQSELRGGEAWDASIRRKIAECALFIPVISAATQSRREGYFRLEWKLGDERTHLMAEGTPFVVPVTIDGTSEKGALVPKSFFAVQWTRIGSAESLHAFGERVKGLLGEQRFGGPSSVEAEGQRVEDGLSAVALAKAKGQRTESLPAVGPAKAGRKAKSFLVWGALAVAVVVAGVLMFSKNPPVSPTVTPVAKPKLEPPSPKAPDLAPAKSVAVLPFANMSPDAENAFFADGIHEDVITGLAKIRDLKVISRTSVLAYRDASSRNLRKIAGELGVATILEGSVRRAGSKVRVTAQLIDARTDDHLWAETYDAELTDVFALQGSLAKEIAGALKANFTASEKSLIERRPTSNQDAYDFFIRGRLLEQALPVDTVRAQYEAVINLYDQAIAADPKFGLAYVHAAYVHGLMYWFGGGDPSPARKELARSSLEMARRLIPDAPETLRAIGNYQYLCENNWAQALVEFAAAEPRLPNDGQLQYMIGVAHRRLGQWTPALERLQRAVSFNPQDLRGCATLMETLFMWRRYAESREMAPRYRTMFPSENGIQGYLNRSQYGLDGDREKFIRASNALPADPDDPFGLNRSFNVGLVDRDLSTVTRQLDDPRMPRRLKAVWGGAMAEPLALAKARVAWLRSDKEAAKRHADEAIVEFKRETWTPRQEPLVAIGVGEANAFAGREEEGSREIQAGLDRLGQSDKFLLPDGLAEAARTYAALGRTEDAIKTLRELFAGPTRTSANEVRNSPFFVKLKSDPRFEEILKAAKPL